MVKCTYHFLTFQQINKVWVFEDDPEPTMVKRQSAIKKVMYGVLFWSTCLVKDIKIEGQNTATTNCPLSGKQLNLFKKFFKRWMLWDSCFTMTMHLRIQQACSRFFWTTKKYIKVIEIHPIHMILLSVNFGYFLILRKLH